MVCDRYSVSDRACAAVATVDLKRYGIVRGSNTENVIDRSKPRREWQSAEKNSEKSDK